MGVERGWGVVGRVRERVVGARACSQQVNRLVDSRKRPTKKTRCAKTPHQRMRHPGAVLAANGTTAALRPTHDSPNDTKGAATPTQLQQKQPLVVSATGDARAETRHQTNFQ